MNQNVAGSGVLWIGLAALPVSGGSAQAAVTYRRVGVTECIVRPLAPVTRAVTTPAVGARAVGVRPGDFHEPPSGGSRVLAFAC